MASKNVRKYLKLNRKFDRLSTTEKEVEKGLQMGIDLDALWNQLRNSEQDDVEEILNME